MMYSKIHEFIVRESLFSSGDKILVALSGGADSVALLHVLLRLGYRCEAAHCNFHLRGEESDRDERFVRELCGSLSVPAHVIHFNTLEYAAEKRLSVEMAARELRYEWFRKKRLETEAAVVAVAHHRDDSVETILLNLIRGTGISGLKGIRPKNGFVVRPLLNVGRHEILEFLSFHGQSYVTDSTNLRDEYTRNKIRLNILPLMEEINPSVKESVAATASRLSEVAAIYNQAIETGKGRVMDGSHIRISALLSETSPRALLFEMLYPLGFNSSQVDDVLGSLCGQSGKCFYSREWSVLKDRDFLLVHPFIPDNCSGNPVSELPGRGGVSYGNPVRRIEVEQKLYTSGFIIPRDKDTACLDAGKLAFPLTVRKWRKGDRFVPFGMKGMKNVSDYLTDKKFSLFEKEQVYVVCSGNEIVWLAGERSDDRYRVDDRTKEVVVLRHISASEK